MDFLTPNELDKAVKDLKLKVGQLDKVITALDLRVQVIHKATDSLLRRVIKLEESQRADPQPLENETVLDPKYRYRLITGDPEDPNFDAEINALLKADDPWVLYGDPIIRPHRTRHDEYIIFQAVIRPRK